MYICIDDRGRFIWQFARNEKRIRELKTRFEGFGFESAYLSSFFLRYKQDNVLNLLNSVSSSMGDPNGAYVE